MVKAGGYSVRGLGFESSRQQILACQEHVQNNMFLYISCIYVFEHGLYIVCTCFNLVQHFLGVENASPCSAQSISLIYAVCTRLSMLHTMLVYRNPPFGTDTAEQRIYPLRISPAGGQLSCAIS